MMDECKICANADNEYCFTCDNGNQFKPMTNADRIRSMSDEELTELFANYNCGYCRIHDFCFGKGCAINCEDMWLDWLKEEAKESE